MTLDDTDIKIEFGNILINVLWLRKAGFDKTTHIQTHCHSGYELHIIPYGYGILSMDNKSFNIKPGTIYLTGPGVYHEQKADYSNPMEEYCINFEILESSRSTPYKTNDDTVVISNTLKNSRFWFGNDIYNMCGLFEKIIEELNNKYIGYYKIIIDYLLQIFINLARCLAKDPLSSYIPPEKTLDDKRRIIIDQYFDIIDRKISIGELAKITGLSIRQLNRIMQDYYGMSFMQKLMKTKMNKAALLLKTTSNSIKDVSLSVGIEDPAYFSRVFKKYWGVPPSQFR